MIAEAALDIRELEEAVAAENRRRYAFYRMLAATDRLLWALEKLNSDGVRRLPEDVRARMRASLAELPETVRNRFAEEGGVQVALDSVFDLQNDLLNLMVPGRRALLAREEGEEEGRPPAAASVPLAVQVKADAFRIRALERIRAAGPHGLAWSDLCGGSVPRAERNRRMCVLAQMEAGGLIRHERRGGLRYFAAGEGGCG